MREKGGRLWEGTEGWGIRSTPERMGGREKKLEWRMKKGRIVKSIKKEEGGTRSRRKRGVRWALMFECWGAGRGVISRWMMCFYLALHFLLALPLPFPSSFPHSHPLFLFLLKDWRGVSSSKRNAFPANGDQAVLCTFTFPPLCSFPSWHRWFRGLWIFRHKRTSDPSAEPPASAVNHTLLSGFQISAAMRGAAVWI